MITIPVDQDLIVRTYHLSDAASLFDTIDKNRNHLRPWLSWVDATTSEEHSLDFIKHSLSQIDNQEGLALGIFKNDDVIGGLGMLHWNHHLKKADIGYWINKENEGKGIITKCLEKFIDFLFTNLDLNKIEIRYLLANKRSAVIAEKLQAKTEGILRDSYLLNGMYKDLVVTGILKKEWMNRK